MMSSRRITHLRVILLIFMTGLLPNIGLSNELTMNPTNRCQKLTEKDITINGIQKLMADPQKSPRSVEDFLCKLPDSFLSNYSLVYESRSLQEGSPEAPRTILFNPNSKKKVFISFNGNPRQLGFNNVELIEETRAPGRFIEFADLDFNKGSSGLSGGQIIKGPNFTFSYGQLNKCMACHANPANQNIPARPLFDAIPTWRNIYDSSLRFPSLITDEEVNNFKLFKISAKSHPRYSNLLNLEKMVVSNKFTFETAILLNRLALKNAELTHLLSTINLRRLVHLIKTSKNYESYKFAIAGALMACREIDKFIPQSLQNFHSNNEFLLPIMQNQQFSKSDIDKIVDITIKISDQIKLEQLGKTPAEMGIIFEELIGTPSMFTKFDNDTFIRSQEWSAPPGVAELRFLLEGRLDPVDMRSWSMDAQKSNYRFTNGAAFREFIDDPDFDQLLRLFVASEPELKFLSPMPSDDQENTCEDLKIKSLDTLERNKDEILNFHPNVIAPQYGQNVMLRKCSGCHSTGALHAPIIPFHDIEHLKQSAFFKNGGKELVNYFTTHGADGKSYMPKFDSLLPSEREAIIIYLNNIR